MSATESTAHGGERVDELAAVVRDLSDRIEALQADVRRLGGPGLPSSEPGWEGQDVKSPSPLSYAWIGSVSAPVRRRPGVPRLLLEILFLAGVAAAAAVAKLTSEEIAIVMAGSWLLVALIEWAASRADRRRDELPAYAKAPAAAPASADPAWFVAPVEHTLVEPAPDSQTAVTRLPPPAGEVEATIERRPGD